MHQSDTIGYKVLQPKRPLNPKAIERIVTLEFRQEAIDASSWAPYLARLT